MKYTYLLIDIATVVVPFIFSFHPKLRFYRVFKAFFPGNLVAAACFIMWDIFFTHQGVWGFNEDYISGIMFFNLPIEEVLFFFCVPFACVFTYFCLGIFFPAWKKHVNVFTALASATLLIFGILFWQLKYTAVTFISTAVLMILFNTWLKQTWMGNLYRAYLILLIPFFVVNGILTGTGLPQPIVWYNNNENLGVRLLTIPIEDMVYGFELLLLTTFFFETFLRLLPEKKSSKAEGSVSF